MKTSKKILVLPNILTMLRVILSPIFLVMFLNMENFIPGLVVFLLVALTDIADGAIARHTKQRTEFGEFLDPMADKFMVILATIAVFIKFEFPTYGLVIFTRDIVSLSGSVLIHQKKKGNWKASKIGKITTFMQISTLGSFVINAPFRFILLLATMIISIMTAKQYFIRGLSILRGKK